MIRNALAAAGLLGLWLAVPAGDAHAYLDPGTGSFLVQMLIGGIAAGAAAISLYWSRLKALVLGSRPHERRGRDRENGRSEADRHG